MNNPQGQNSPNIRWVLHIFTISILGWALITGFQAHSNGGSEELTALMQSVTSYQALFGVVLIVASSVYPITKAFIQKKTDIREEDHNSSVAFLYGLALVTTGFGVYEGWEYGLLMENELLLIITNGLLFFLLSRPAANHIIYRMGLWWFTISLFVMLIAISYKADK